jgi:fatty-acyl-CoA synthase
MDVRWNIGLLLKKKATSTPNKEIIIFEDRRITYKEFNDAANRVAHYLQSLGMKKGDRVAAITLNCPEFIALYFAVAKLGLVLVPLNFRLVGPEIEYQINNSGSRMLFFHDAFIPNFEKVMGRLTVDKDKYVFINTLKSDKPCPDWAVRYDEKVPKFPSTEAQPEEPVYLEDPLAIIYTSGVTGAPKGAMVNHNQTFYKVMNTTMGGHTTPNDVFLAQLPLCHSGGLFICLTPCFARGMTLVLRQGFDPNKFAEDIGTYKATTVFALTTMWRFILETGKLDSVDTSSVRTTLGGGERTPISLIEALAQRGLFMQQGFGQTENSAMMALPIEDYKRKQGSIGRPGMFSEIWIEGPDGSPLPANEVGEIVAYGPLVMSGYWNMPEKTAETIVGGVLHTGDLGYVDDEGYFYIVDRAKDMYRSGGENVYPAEIEKALSDHPSVQNVAIIGVPDEKWGETGKAFIVCQPGQTITLEEVHQFLEGKVARYKYPQRVEILSALPVTSSGKIKKAELKNMEGVRLDK